MEESTNNHAQVDVKRLFCGGGCWRGRQGGVGGVPVLVEVSIVRVRGWFMAVVSGGYGCGCGRLLRLGLSSCRGADP